MSESGLQIEMTDDLRRIASLAEISKLNLPLALCLSKAPFDIVNLRTQGRLFKLNKHPSYEFITSILEANGLALALKELDLFARIAAWDEEEPVGVTRLFERRSRGNDDENDQL